MPCRPHAATVVLVGALTLILGVTIAPSAGMAGSPPAPGSQGESPGHATTRLLDTPFPDPGFYVEGRRRYIYATGYDARRGWRAYRAAQWDPERRRYTKPRPSMLTRPRWVGPRGPGVDAGQVHMWAPTVWKRKVKGPRDYVMYFSASRRGGRDCLGMAVATSPLGPFVPKPRPLRCGTGGSTLIDPVHFRNRAGQHFVVYKRRAFGPPSIGIWALRVRHDGTARPHARSVRLVDGGRAGLEAPSVVSRRGRTYLFASRHRYDTCQYETVVYVSGRGHRPFRSLGRLDLRRPGGGRFCGPGGAEVRNVGGIFRVVFHAFDSNPRVVRNARRLAWGVPLRWTRQGRPYAAPRRPDSRFVPSATVSRRTKSGSSSFSPYRSRS